MPVHRTTVAGIGACGFPEDEISGNDEDPFPPEMVLKF
jgi:hypothetical protein